MTVLYVNGRCYLNDDSGSFVGAMACGGGRIIGVGSRSDLRRRFSNCEEIDLGGKLVLPAFADAHTHFAAYCLAQNDVDLSDATSVQACVQRIAVRARTLPPGAWIRGSGWNHNLWSPPTWPTRWQLDEATLDHPVVLDARDFHSAWVNTSAVNAAGIDQNTTWGTDGEIVRDAHGLATGILKEEARQLIWRVLPEPSVEETGAAIANHQKLAFQNGFASIGSMETLRDWQAFQSLRNSGRLRLRVCFYMPIRFLEDALDQGLKSGDGDEWLRFGGTKLFLDGTLGSQTAWMLEPYENDRRVGTPLMTAEEAAGHIRRAAQHRIACAVHAIGDHANRAALDAFESVPKEYRGLRQRIEHAQLVHDDDIPRFGKLHVVASMQPIHIPGDIDPANRYWGSRTKGAYAFRSLIDHGAVLAFGSDVPIETCNVFAGIDAALRRTKSHQTDAWHPEQRIRLEEIIQAYTRGAAYATGEETQKGRLVPGYLADFMSVSQDIFRVPPESIRETRVERMVVGGEVVYAAN